MEPRPGTCEGFPTSMDTNDPKPLSERVIPPPWLVAVASVVLAISAQKLAADNGFGDPWMTLFAGFGFGLAYERQFGGKQRKSKS